MVASQNIMVNTIAMNFLFFVKSIEIAVPTMAPKNHIMMIMIEFFGVL